MFGPDSPSQELAFLLAPWGDSYGVKFEPFPPLEAGVMGNIMGSMQWNSDTFCTSR